MMIFETRIISLSLACSNISNSIESVEAHENSNLWITKAHNFNQSTPRNSRGIAIKFERERIRSRLDILTSYKKLALQPLKRTNENNNKEQSNNNWNIFRVVVFVCFECSGISLCSRHTHAWNLDAPRHSLSNKKGYHNNVVHKANLCYRLESEQQAFLSESDYAFKLGILWQWCKLLNSEIFQKFLKEAT